ncbi:MAG: aldolase/citrate lyase family protein [Janthinobacterium lividum]
MKSIRPYHFARLQRTGFLPYYRTIIAAGGVVCFDFEDSVEASDAAATLALKKAQRRQVRQLLRVAGLDAGQVGIRLNAPGTTHYLADLRALRGGPDLHTVFVPKVEHPDVLAQVLRELPVAVRHLVAVVETRAGMAALPALLHLRDPRLGLVAFGHCDYNLSCGHFPFFHQDSSRYWEWLAELDAHLRAAGKQLINSPVLQLADAALFQAVLRRLRTLPSVVGQLTLCLSQTLACQQAAADPLPTLAVGQAPECAHCLAHSFEQARAGNRAFAVDAQRRLISPHEYAAAQRLLL